MDFDTTDELLESFQYATDVLHFCPNRLWAVARERLPKLLPKKLREKYPHEENANHRFYDPDRSHELCTFDFCEYAQRDFTAMPQRHECKDDSCLPLSGLFPRHLLDQAATNGTPTAWDLSGTEMIRSPQPYMAISHVWGDGTGPGQLKDGQVHACLFQFFQDIARELHCEGIWWDTVCIPSERKARSRAIRNMHYNYLDARVTLVHDCFLRNWEWDPETACFGILMSPWFSRGWTALELANSRNVKVLFKDKDCGLVIKDLDQEILSKDDDPDGPKKEATAIIKVFRKDFIQNEQRNLNDLLIALGSRHTSWPKDMAIIAALLTGAEPADNQTDTYKHVLHSAGRMLHGHLFHNAVTPSRGLTWCPTDLFKMPQQAIKPGMTDLTISANGSLQGVWRTREVGVAKDQLVWDHGTHLLIRKHIQHALKQHHSCRLLAEPGFEPVERALLVSSVNLQPLQRPLEGSCFYFIGALYFREPLPNEDWNTEAISISGMEDSLVNTVDNREDHVNGEHAFSQHQTIWRGDWMKFQAISDSLDLQIPDRLGRRLLHLAAERGYEEMVEIILKKASLEGTLRSVLEARSEGGVIPLHLAAQTGSSAVVRQLLQAGSDVRARDNIGNSAIHYAAQIGYLSIIEALLLDAGRDLANFSDCNGATPLHFAAANGHAHIIPTLIQAGATIETRDNFGWAPLHYAAFRGKPDAFLLLFHDSPCRALEDERSGWTVLHFAALSGSEAMSNLLLDKEFDPFARDHFGWQPQDLARVVGNHEISRLLSSEGDPSNLPVEPIQIPWTPLHVMLLEGPSLVLRSVLHGKFDFEQICLQNPIDALNFAAGYGLMAAVRWLMENPDGPRVKMNQSDQRGRGPLSFASENGQDRMVRYLLEKGADVYAFDNSGMTPVSWAALNCHDTTLRQLAPSPRNQYPQFYLLSWICEQCCTGTTEAFRRIILKKNDAKALPRPLRALLTVAARADHGEIVQSLLLEGRTGYESEYESDELWNLASSRASLHTIRSIIPTCHHENLSFSSKDSVWQAAIGSGRFPTARFLFTKFGPSWRWPFHKFKDNQKLFDFLRPAITSGNETLVNFLIDQGVMFMEQTFSSSLCSAVSGSHVAITQRLIDTMREAFRFVEALEAWLEIGQAFPETMANLRKKELNILKRHRSSISSLSGEQKINLYQAVKDGPSAIKFLFGEAFEEAWLLRQSFAKHLILATKSHPEGSKGSIIRQEPNRTERCKTDGAILLDSLRIALCQGDAVISSLLAQTLIEMGGLPQESIIDILWKAKVPTVVQILLETARHNFDGTAADWQTFVSTLPTIYAPNNASAMQLLLGNGVRLSDEMFNWVARTGKRKIGIMELFLGNGPCPSDCVAQAAEVGHLEVVRLLVDHGAYYDHEDMLFYAAVHGWAQMALDILERGVQKKDWLLRYAQGRLQKWQFEILCFKVRLEGDPKFKMGFGTGSPLWWAVFNGHEDVVRLLIEHGADVNHSYGVKDSTPLWWAAFWGHQGVLRLLIERGTGARSPNPDLNAEVLLNAIGLEYHETLRLLTRLGPDAFPWDRTRIAPKILLGAARNGLSDVVQQMIERGSPISKTYQPANLLNYLGWSSTFWESRRVSSSLTAGHSKFDRKPMWTWGLGGRLLDPEPLWHALELGHLGVVQALIGKGATFDSSFNRSDIKHFSRSDDDWPSGGRGRTFSFEDVLFIYAALHGWYDIVQGLTGRVRHIDVSAPKDLRTCSAYRKCTVRLDHCGDTALIAAAKNGHESIVRLLVENGANLEATDFHQITPIKAAIVHGHTNIATFLVNSGAKTWKYLPDSLEYRPTIDLHTMASKGAQRKVDKPLYDFDHLHKKKTKAPFEMLILVAALAGHEAMAQFLFEQGLSRVYSSTAAQHHGISLLDVAAEKGQSTLAGMLLKEGCQPPFFCMTALRRALKKKHHDIARLIVDHAIANKYKNPTPLGLVAADGSRSDVELVLSCGADVNGRGVHDRTALWWAAKNGRWNVVKLLLDRGADVNAVDDEGRTALWQAGKDEHEDVMNLLRERGAV